MLNLQLVQIFLNFNHSYLFARVLPESPRWLLAKGRLEEALLILEKLAATNGKELPASFRQTLKVCIKRDTI